MGFITHCWKSVLAETWRLLAWAVGAWLLAASCAWAQNSMLELVELHAERRETDLVLTAQLKLELGQSVEDALVKGLAVHFIAETEVMRNRWYWYDKKMVHRTRFYRLAFQPLTRRWRLNVSNEPLSGAGLAGSIAQNFETLPEALDVIRRQSGWKVADTKDLDLDSRQYIVYKFSLDTSQLPRPFQIATGNQTEWNLVVERQLRLSKDMIR